MHPDSDSPVPPERSRESVLPWILLAAGLATLGPTAWYSHQLSQDQLVLKQQVDDLLRLHAIPAAAVQDDDGGEDERRNQPRVAAVAQTTEQLQTHQRASRWLAVVSTLLLVAGSLILAWSARQQRQRQQRHLQREQEQTHRQTQLLSALFTRDLFGVHIFDGNGKALYSASNNARRRGLQAVDFAADGVTDIRTHALAEAMGVVDDIDRALSTGETISLSARPLLLPSADTSEPAQTLWLAPLFIPLRDHHDQVDRLAIIIQDETDERALSQRVRRAEHLAEVGTLSAGVAHEINNPLSFVSMNVLTIREMLGDLLPPLAELESLFDDIQHGLTRIQNVTSDLSALTLVQEDATGSIELKPVLEQVVRMVQSTQSDPPVPMRVRLPSLPRVQSSAGRLEQIFTNLLQNALHACQGRPASHVELVAGTLNDTSVWVEVRDTGSGISEQDADRIFEPFFTKRRGGRGTGLGLYLVRCYLEDLGGSIEMRSVEAEGTCMRVTLPVAADGSPGEATAASEPPLGAPGHTILTLVRATVGPDSTP